MPDDFLFRTALPTTLILYPKSLRSSVEHQMIQQLDQVLGKPATPDRFRPMTDFRFADPDSIYLFVFLNRNGSEMNPYWQPYGSSAQQEDELDFVYSPTYLQFLLGARAPPLPEWFNTGITRLYGFNQFSWRTEGFIPDGWLSSGAAEALQNDAMAPRPLLPMRELFIPSFPREKSPEYGRVWRAQAELFIRWALSDQVSGGKERLWRFAAATATQPTTEALFQSCFGMDYADARDALSDFLPKAVEKTLRVPPGPEHKLPRIWLRKATSGEIRRIKGEWARRALPIVKSLYPEALPLYTDHARELLQGAYDKGERDPRLLASLALFRVETGDTAGGRAILEGNAAACAARPLADLELAQLQLLDALRQPGGPKGSLSDAQAAGILGAVGAALKRGPPMEGAYLLAARTVEHLGREPSLGERALLAEGARLFPRNSPLVIESASWDLRAGNVAEAHTLTELGLWECSDPSDFQELAVLNGLARPAPSPSNGTNRP
jgi:hypothetical protein